MEELRTKLGPQAVGVLSLCLGNSEEAALQPIPGEVGGLPGRGHARDEALLVWKMPAACRRAT